MQPAMVLMSMCICTVTPGLEVIKLEHSLRLKIKRNDWLLADKCPQQPIIALYFESENEFKFYNLEARAFAVYTK